MRVIIGSLNCLNFGRESLKKKDIDLIANIILGEKIDIIALQEIKHEEAVNSIVGNLNRSSVYKWSSCCDKAEYAFIWNSNKLDYPRTKLSDGNIRVFYPHIYKQYSRTQELKNIDISRPPLYGRFQTIIPGLPKIEFRLINTHIRYSKGKDGKELPVTVSEKMLRENEFKALTKSIYYYISDKEYGKREGEGDPRNSYTILLGDYNLNLRESFAGSPYLEKNYESIHIPSLSTKTEKGQKIIVTEQKERSTLRKPQDLDEEQKDFFANNYDHFSYDKNRFSGVTFLGTTVNTVKKYCDNDLKSHYEKVSDHVLIKMTFKLHEG